MHDMQPRSCITVCGANELTCKRCGTTAHTPVCVVCDIKEGMNDKAKLAAANPDHFVRTVDYLNEEEYIIV